MGRDVHSLMLSIQQFLFRPGVAVVARDLPEPCGQGEGGTKVFTDQFPA